MPSDTFNPVSEDDVIGRDYGDVNGTQLQAA